MEGPWKDDSGTILSCDKGKNNQDGSKCAARIIEEGWQMNY